MNKMILAIAGGFALCSSVALAHDGDGAHHHHGRHHRHHGHYTCEQVQSAVATHGKLKIHGRWYVDAAEKCPNDGFNRSTANYGFLATADNAQCHVGFVCSK